MAFSQNVCIYLRDTQGIDSSVQNDDFKIPEKLRRLKLHGHEHVDKLPGWILLLRQLDLEVSTFTPQDSVLL